MEPTNQWHQGYDQFAGPLARRDQHGLDGSAVEPEPVNHKVNRNRARVHPLDFRLLVEAAYVFHFHEQARRVTRVVFIVSDLECERAVSCEEIALLRHALAV